MNVDGNVEMNLKKGIRMARHEFSLLRQTCKCRKINSKTKLRVFQTNVSYVLLYGVEDDNKGP